MEVVSVRTHTHTNTHTHTYTHTPLPKPAKPAGYFKDRAFVVSLLVMQRGRFLLSCQRQTVYSNNIRYILHFVEIILLVVTPWHTFTTIYIFLETPFSIPFVCVCVCVMLVCVQEWGERGRSAEEVGGECVNGLWLLLLLVTYCTKRQHIEGHF